MKKMQHIIFFIAILIVIISTGTVKTEAKTKPTFKLDVDYRLEVLKDGKINYYYDVIVYRSSLLKCYSTPKKADRELKNFVREIKEDSQALYIDAEKEDIFSCVKVEKYKKKGDTVYKIISNIKKMKAYEYDALTEGAHMNTNLHKQKVYEDLNPLKQYAFSDKNLYIQVNSKNMAKNVLWEMQSYGLGEFAEKCKLKLKFSYICKMPYKVKKTNGKISKSDETVVSYDYTYIGGKAKYKKLKYKKFLKYDSFYVSTTGKTKKELEKEYYDNVKQDGAKFTVTTTDYKNYKIINNNKNREKSYYEYSLMNSGEDEEEGYGAWTEVSSRKQNMIIRLNTAYENNKIIVDSIDQYGNQDEFYVKVEK